MGRDYKQTDFRLLQMPQNQSRMVLELWKTQQFHLSRDLNGFMAMGFYSAHSVHFSISSSTSVALSSVHKSCAPASWTSPSLATSFLYLRNEKLGQISRCGLTSVEQRRGWLLPLFFRLCSWCYSPWCSQRATLPGFNALPCLWQIPGPFWQSCSPARQCSACITAR